MQIICDRIWENQLVKRENQLSHMRRNSRSSTKTLMKKKHVLLGDEASDWLQIWMTSSSLDIKGKKAIKNIFVFLTNWLVFPNTVTFVIQKS